MFTAAGPQAVKSILWKAAIIWISLGEPFITEAHGLTIFTQGVLTVNGMDFSADYHIYSIEWEPTVMRWYVDGVLYSTKTSWWSSGGAYPAPFNQRFHILLNLAVGGTYTGIYNWHDVTTNLPQQMLIDWVRVYQKN